MAIFGFYGFMIFQDLPVKYLYAQGSGAQVPGVIYTNMHLLKPKSDILDIFIQLTLVIFGFYEFIIFQDQPIKYLYYTKSVLI